MDDRQLIEDLLSALEYHIEQTRPIQFSTVAIEAAREYLRKPAQRKQLTTQEIREWWASENGLEDCKMSKMDDFEKVVHAVEAKHGIKEKTND